MKPNDLRRLAAGMALLSLLSACGGSDERERRGERDTFRSERSENASAARDNAPQAPDPAPQDEAAAAAPPVNGMSAFRTRAAAASEERGPTRSARCEFNEEPQEACSFTAVFGDGSFDVKTPDRNVRLVVEGEEAAAFEVFGADRRVPLPGNFRRDAKDRACWVADDRELPLFRVCAR